MWLRAAAGLVCHSCYPLHLTIMTRAHRRRNGNSDCCGSTIKKQQKPVTPMPDARCKARWGREIHLLTPSSFVAVFHKRGNLTRKPKRQQTPSRNPLIVSRRTLIKMAVFAPACYRVLTFFLGGNNGHSANSESKAELAGARGDSEFTVLQRSKVRILQQLEKSTSGATEACQFSLISAGRQGRSGLRHVSPHGPRHDNLNVRLDETQTSCGISMLRRELFCNA